MSATDYMCITLPVHGVDAMETASDDDSSSPIPGVTNPSVSAMASHIFDRLVSHSRFVPSMLDMTHSLLPLPAAAQNLKLQSPLSSVVPLVECCPVAQVCLSVQRLTVSVGVLQQSCKYCMAIISTHTHTRTHVRTYACTHMSHV